MRKNQSGFTLIELVVVMGILLMLFGFVSFNLVGVQRITSVTGTSDVIVSDISMQQTKAMLGAGSSSGNSYGIYFESDKYTLFKGVSYNASDPENFTIFLDPGIIFSNITLPANSLIFEPTSGEVSGFINGQNTIKLEDTQGSKTITLTINRYGVVTSEN